MDHLQLGRVFMGDSLGLHIIFALIGVGLPLFTSALEFIAIRRKDNNLRETARLWSYVSGVLVIAGVLSGTVIALQMFFVWPGILNWGGSAVGLGFTLEGYMFMLEAIFLPFYIKMWSTLKGYAHWVLSLPIVIGALGSAVMITAVDAWMNHPTGMTVVDGQIVSAQPMKALFNETTFFQATHSILGYYLTVGLMLLGAYAWMLYRGHKPKVGDAKTTRFIMIRLAIASLVLVASVGVLGDLSAKYLARDEPTKLAAIEMLQNTTTNAPLILGGTPLQDGSVSGGISVPGGLSFLATGSTSGEVKGLNEVPRSEWPPFVIHTLFDIKMLIVGLTILIPLIFVLLYRKSVKKAFGRPMLLALIAAPFLSVALVELGWMITEIGRQPYAVYGHVLTRDAITQSHDVMAIAWLFPSAFVVLTAVTIWALTLTIKRFKPVSARSSSERSKR